MYGCGQIITYVDFMFGFPLFFFFYSANIKLILRFGINYTNNSHKSYQNERKKICYLQ